jgi:hypothetical protein
MDLLRYVVQVKGVGTGAASAIEQAARLAAFRREALLANPLLDFDRLLLVKRGTTSPQMGLVGQLGEQLQPAAERLR